MSNLVLDKKLSDRKSANYTSRSLYLRRRYAAVFTTLHTVVSKCRILVDTE